jgi:predicted aspartyl protease
MILQISRYWEACFKSFVLNLVFVAMLSNPYACAQISTPLNLLEQSDPLYMPFDYTNGFIIIDVVFQKIIPLRFILDTGAENTILLKREYADMVRLPYHKKIKLLGSDMSKDVHAYVSNGASLQLVNAPTIRHNIIVLAEDYLLLEEYIGAKVDGIIGAEFFKGLLLKIDYSKRVITVSDPDKNLVKKIKDFHAFPLEIFNYKPYLNCVAEINSGYPVNTRLLIDTGAGLTALFHNNTDSMMQLKGQIVKGTLGKGLGGEIEGFSGKIHKLIIGDLYFNSMISSFQDLELSILESDKIKRNGLLGNILLDRFEVILDFKNAQLYLKPDKDYNRDFEFDKSGMAVFAFSEKLNKYYVKYVVDSSPAYEADIRPGDIILKIGCLSYQWYTLQNITKKLSGKSGKKIKLKIKRGNEVLKKEVILRDLFQLDIHK